MLSKIMYRNHKAVYLIISALILFNLLLPGYILTLDGTIAPKAYDPFFISDSIYGLGSSSQYMKTWLPVYISIEILKYFISLWIIQKIVWVLILSIAGISAYNLVPTDSKAAKYFAGILYMVNPFIYVRFLAGHWLILLAYGIVPFAVKAFLDMLQGQNKKNFIKALLWVTAVGILNVQILILTLLAYFLLFVFKFMWAEKEVRGKLLKSVSLLLPLYVIVNTYWLLPVLTADSTILEQIGGKDIFAFAPKISAFSAAFTIASMYGFWRGGYVYAKDFIPYWYVLFFFILFLAVHGFIANYRDKKIGWIVKSFGVIAVIAMILGSGIHGPFSSLFEFLYDKVFFFRGFRDSHKFVAMLVLAYAYLGALGVGEFEKGRRDANIRKKYFSMAIVILALAAPLAYSFTMFNGFWGQLKPTNYPEDWYEVNEFLNKDEQEFNVLFLPWHQYMDFEWIPNRDKRIANPAFTFFDKSVIQGENIEVAGIYSQSNDPMQRYIEFLLANRNNLTNFGNLIAPLNVKYILLTKEVDYKEYFFLFDQSDLELVKETENFYVFRNRHDISKIYEVDGIVYIKDWNELLKRSKSEDITKSLYIISNQSSSSDVLSEKKVLDYEKKSPVKYKLKEEPSKRYIIFTEPYSDYWELGGRKPIKAYDVVNAYEAGDEDIKYQRFYQLYLPAYAISLLVFLALIGVYFDFHRKIRNLIRRG